MSDSPVSPYFTNNGHFSWWDPVLIASSSSEHLPGPIPHHTEADVIPDMDTDLHDDHEEPLTAGDVLEELFPLNTGRTDSLSSATSSGGPPTPPPLTVRPIQTPPAPSSLRKSPFPSVAPYPHGLHTHHRRRPSSISSSASSLASAQTKNTLPRSILSRSVSRTGGGGSGSQHHGSQGHYGTGNSVKFAERPIVLSCRYEEDEDGAGEDEDDVDSAYASADEHLPSSKPPSIRLIASPPPPASKPASPPSVRYTPSVTRAPSIRSIPRSPATTIASRRSETNLTDSGARPGLPVRGSSESTYRTAAASAPIPTSPPPPGFGLAPKERKAGLLKKLASSLNLAGPSMSSSPGASGSRSAPPTAPIWERKSKEREREKEKRKPRESAPGRLGRSMSQSTGREKLKERSRTPAPAPPRISGPLPLASAASRAAAINHSLRTEQQQQEPQEGWRRFGASRISLDARSMRSEKSATAGGLKGVLGRWVR